MSAATASMAMTTATKPCCSHFRRETRSTTFRAVRGAGMTSAMSGNDLLAAIELPRIRQHPPSPSLRPSWRKLTMSPVPPIPAWCDNEAVVSLHQFRSARRGELGDGSTDRRIQRSVAAGAGRPAARSPRDCGIAAAPRDLAADPYPGGPGARQRAQRRGPDRRRRSSVASHHASLSQPRDVRERLVFVRMQPIGSVHLRPRGLDVCALRGRITRVLRSGAAIRNVAIDPEQRA